MPSGIFATRADLFMDVAISFLTALPALMGLALRFARTRRYRAHRNTQAATLLVVLVVVVLLELDIRLSGGTAAFLAHAPGRLELVRPLLFVHVAAATLTAIAWLILAVISWRRFRITLPGTFSRLHRRIGWTTFAGACFLSSSGAALYALCFVL